VSFLAKRIQEGKKLGYRRIIGPEQVKTLLEALRVLK
jgi:predicted ATP-dependent serine protease